jgi:hypothetical protein
MSQPSYEIVFYGNLVEGFSIDETKKHVAQLFKTNVDQVERMFTGKRVVIRNKLDQDTALKYIVAMQKRGAACQIEAMGAAGVKVEFSGVAAQTPAPASAPSAASAPAEPSRPETVEAKASFVQASPAGSESRPVSRETENKSGLPIAGEKVDEILSSAHFELNQTGCRLSDEKEDVHLDLPGLDAISLAPVGSDITEKKPDIPVSVPDISHLSLE